MGARDGRHGAEGLSVFFQNSCGRLENIPMTCFDNRDEIEFAASLISDLSAAAERCDAVTLPNDSDKSLLPLNSATAQKIQDYLLSPSSSPLLVTGCEGCGASSLLSVALSNLRSSNRIGSDPLVVRCDIGKGDGGRSYLKVLRHFVTAVVERFPDLEFSRSENETLTSFDEGQNPRFCFGNFFSSFPFISSHKINFIHTYFHIHSHL